MDRLARSSCPSVAVVVVAASLALGCATSGAGGALPSSASQPGYAMKYPDAVASTNKAVADRQTEAKELEAKFPPRIDEIKKTDWSKVEAVVEKADDSGRGAGYASTQAEAGTIRTFFSEDKDVISGKVAGSAQHAATQAGCTVDVGGAAAYGLKDGVDKQLEKRARAKNEAFVILERYAVPLGKENAATLEKLADEVARASYIANVLLPEERERLRARLAEKGSIAKTLEGIERDEKAFQAEPGRTEPEKKASEERIAAAAKARAELDRASAQGSATLEDLDKQIDAAKKDYERALDTTRTKIAEKRKAAAARP